MKDKTVLKQSIFTASLITLSSGVLAETTYLSYSGGVAVLKVRGDREYNFSVGTVFEEQKEKLTYGADINGLYLKPGKELTGTADFNLGYEIIPNVTLRGAFGIENTDGSEDKQFSIGADYAFGDMTTGLAYSKIGDVKIRTLYTQYASGPTTLNAAFHDADGGSVYQVGASYDQDAVDISLDYFKADTLSVFDLEGSYDFFDNWRGEFFATDTDSNIDRLKTYRAGVGYQIVDNFWLSGNVGRSTTRSESGNIFSLFLTSEIGKRQNAFATNTPKKLTISDFFGL